MLSSLRWRAGFVASLALTFSPAARVSALPSQVYVRYHYEIQGSTAPPMGDISVWRSGDRYARVETPLPERKKAYAVMIVDEPAIYLFRKGAREGQKLADPDPQGKVHIQIAPLDPSGDLKDLEIGREIQFFRSQKAKRRPDQIVAGRRRAVFELHLRRYDLRLFIDLSHRRPLKLSIRAGKTALAIVYSAYELHQHFAASLYRVPAGMRLTASKMNLGAASAPSKHLDTPFPENVQPGFWFSASQAGRRVRLDSNTCGDRPVFICSFDPEAPEAGEVISELARLYQEFKDTQLCFIPAPRGSLNTQQNNYPFPVYQLAYADAPGLTTVDKPMALFLRRNAQSLLSPLPGAEWQLHSAVDDGSPDSDIPVGDLEEQWRRVDAELDTPNRLDVILELIAKRDFDGLDRIFKADRTLGQGTINGHWLLLADYQDILVGANDDSSVHQRMDFLSNWISAKPESVSPRIALAELWSRYAWLARGHGYANEVAASQGALFAEREEQARKLLFAAQSLKEKDPELQTALIYVAEAQGWPRDKVEGIFREGQSQFPTYQYLYVAMAEYLFPKWEGAPGDWERFAEEVAKENPGGEGYELYSRIGLLVKDQLEFGWLGTQLFQNSQLSWPMFKRGEDDIIARYPKSKVNLNYYAFFACAAGDKITARALFQRIGDDYSVRVWGNRVVYDRSRRWAGITTPSKPVHLPAPDTSGDVATPVAPKVPAASVKMFHGHRVIMAQRNPDWRPPIRSPTNSAASTPTLMRTPATHSVSELCSMTTNIRTRYQALKALGALGPSAAPAIPTLLKMTSAKFPPANGPVMAVFVAGRWRLKPMPEKSGHPPPAPAPSDDVQAQLLAIQALGDMGPVARIALPRLIEIIANNDNRTDRPFLGDRIPLRTTALEAAVRIAPPQSETRQELLRWLKQGAGARALAAKEFEMLLPDDSDILSKLIAATKERGVAASQDYFALRSAIDAILMAHPSLFSNGGTPEEDVARANPNRSPSDVKGLTADLGSPNQKTREQALDELSKKQRLSPETLFSIREMTKRLTLTRKPEKEIDTLALPENLMGTPLPIAIAEVSWEPGFLPSLSRVASNNPTWAIQQLSEGDPDITLGLLTAIRRWPAPVPDNLIAGVIAACNNPNAALRKMAFDMLTPAARNYPEMFAIALKELNDPDNQLQGKAQSVIEHYYLAPKNLYPILRTKAGLTSVIILEMDCKARLPPLTDALLHDPDSQVRRTAAALIPASCAGRSAKLPDALRDLAFQTLLTSVNDRTPEVRQLAVRGIGELAAQYPSVASAVAKKLQRKRFALDSGKSLGYAVWWALFNHKPAEESQIEAALRDAPH